MGDSRDEQAARLDELAGFQPDGGPIDRDPSPMWRNYSGYDPLTAPEGTREMAGRFMGEPDNRAERDEGKCPTCGTPDRHQPGRDPIDRLAEIDDQGRLILLTQKPHIEAMRMQALAIGARLWREVASFTAPSKIPDQQEWTLRVARWAYREATGREW